MECAAGGAQSVLRDLAIILLLAAALWSIAAAMVDARRWHTSNFLNDQIEYSTVGRNWASTGTLTSNITFPSTLWQPFTKNYVYMPGYYFVLGVVYKYLGFGVANSLLPSALSFLIASAGVYLIGRKLYDGPTGFVAAVLFMLFPPILYFSCTAMLELTLLAATVATLAIFVYVPPQFKTVAGPLLLLLPLLFRETAVLLAFPMAVLILLAHGTRRGKVGSTALFCILAVALSMAVMRSPIASGRISLWAANLFDPTPHAIYASAVAQKALATTHHSMLGAVIYKLKSNIHFTLLMVRNSLIDADQRYEFLALFLIAAGMCAVLVAGVRSRQAPLLAAGGMTLLMFLALVTIYNLHGYRGVRVLLFCVPLLAVGIAHLCLTAKHARPWTIAVVAFSAIAAVSTLATRAQCTQRDDALEAYDTMALDMLHHDDRRMLVAPYEIAMRYAFDHYPVKYSFSPGDIATLEMLEERFDVGTLICPTSGTEALPAAQLLKRGYRLRGTFTASDLNTYAVFTRPVVAPSSKQ